MPSAKDWRVITEVFHSCRELGERERTAFLDERRLQADVRGEVERLLAHDGPQTEACFQPLQTVRDLFSEIPPLFEEGQCVGSRFIIDRFIRRGGMGEVYAARDSAGQPVALKVIRPLYGSTEVTLLRFRKEFSSQRLIIHPNVCRVFELLTHKNGTVSAEFFTMVLLEGETLSERLRKEPILPKDVAERVARDILSGLAAAHSRGIIHRDLKPSNIMLVPEPGDTHRAVLLDFGLARLSDELLSGASLTRSGEVVGTLDYMAPEQIMSQTADARTDLYAFGLICLEFLTGKHPVGDPRASAAGGRRRDLRGVADTGVHWRRMLSVCLAPDPRDRLRSAGATLELFEGRKVLFPVRMPIRMRRRAFLGSVVAGAFGVSLTSYIKWRSVTFARGVGVIVADALARDSVAARAVSWQLRRALALSGHVAVWPEDKLSSAWLRMTKSGVPAPTGREWREIALREKMTLVVFPTVTRTELRLRAEQVVGNPDRPARVWSMSIPVRKEDEIVSSLDRAALWVRDLAGESAVEIANTAGIEAVTTPSWNALKEFNRGEKLATERDFESAILAYSSAVRIDPDFTMAWMRRGDTQMSLGRENEGFAAWATAVESTKNRPLTRQEDLRFRAMLTTDAGEYQASEKLFAEYVHYFPNDWFGYFYREFPLLMTGRPDEAIEMMKRCIDFPERRGRAHMKLSWAYVYKGDLNEARNHVSALDRMGSASLSAWARVAIYNAEDNTEAALDALHGAATDSQLVPTTMHDLYACNILADAGRIEQAVKVASDSAEIDLRKGAHAERAKKIISVASLIFAVGSRAESLRRLAALDAGDLGPNNVADAAMLYARQGSVPDALRLMGRLRSDLPYARFRIAQLRTSGEIALTEGHLQKGVSAMVKAANLDSRAWGAHYLAYARERAGMRQQALDEFRAHLKSRSFQVHLLSPEPAGTWRNSLSAVRRLT